MTGGRETCRRLGWYPGGAARVLSMNHTLRDQGRMGGDATYPQDRIRIRPSGEVGPSELLNDTLCGGETLEV
jgi:hypothetical protein